MGLQIAKERGREWVAGVHITVAPTPAPVAVLTLVGPLSPLPWTDLNLLHTLGLVETLRVPAALKLPASAHLPGSSCPSTLFFLHRPYSSAHPSRLTPSRGLDPRLGPQARCPDLEGLPCSPPARLDTPPPPPAHRCPPGLLAGTCLQWGWARSVDSRGGCHCVCLSPRCPAMGHRKSCCTRMEGPESRVEPYVGRGRTCV